MAQRDRAWRRRKARTLMTKVAELKHRFTPSDLPERPHAAQKARSWWRTEQELREAF